MSSEHAVEVCTRRKLPQISFSRDWNSKLTVCGKLFSTIRKSSVQKLSYYKSHVGETFEVVLKDKVIGEATLLLCSGMRFSDLTLPLLMIDSGYSDPAKIDKLFKNFGIQSDDAVLVLVFEKSSTSVSKKEV